MKRITTIGSLALLLLWGCAAQETITPERAANELAKNSIIVDTHIDVPFRLGRKPDDVSNSTESGDFDYPRAVNGGLNAPFMSIYTPADFDENGASFANAVALIDLVESIVAAAPEKFAIAKTPDDVRAHFNAGLISLPLGMENGSPIEGDLSRLEFFHQRGIRYITLTHGKSNHISDSSYDTNRQWNGLSEFGERVVLEMNRLGIMIDVSHVSDDAFWDVIRLTKVPVIASHSSARHFTPGFERNMSDEMIKALAKNGGVIMINFGSAFLTEKANEYSLARRAAEDAWRVDNPGLGDAEAGDLHDAIWAAEHGPYPFADIDDVLNHIDHVVKLVGVDYVGIGSDYDGVGDSLPTGLKDVSTYPNLVDGMLRRDYSDTDIQKILGENVLRVWNAVLNNTAAD